MQLFLDVGFKADKQNSITISMKSSGFLGKKKDIFYFSPNLMFFDEKEIIAQILYKDETSLIVRPQIEMEMHFAKIKSLDFETNPHLKLCFQDSFENLMIGDDIYMGQQRFSFCMQVSKDVVKLSRVAAPNPSSTRTSTRTASR